MYYENMCWIKLFFSKHEEAKIDREIFAVCLVENNQLAYLRKNEQNWIN